MLWRRKRKEYIRCMVKFDENELLHSFTVLDESIKIGDRVLIPRVDDEKEKIGTVVIIKRVRQDEPPYNYELAEKIKKL